MPSSKTKTELGRHSFEGRAAFRITNPNGSIYLDTSGFHRRPPYVRPGVVTFAPYSQDGWRAKIAQHRDATTFMSGNRLRIEEAKQYKFSTTTRQFDGSFYQWEGSGQLFASAGDFPAVIGGGPNAVAQASEKFIASLIDATHDIRGASVLAEAMEAVRGIASPAKALRHEVGNLYATARKRMYRDRNKSLAAMRDVVAGTWLEWNFGIKPTVQDANDAADALNKLRTRELVATFPVRGRSRASENIGYNANVNFPSVSIPPGYSTIPAMYDWWVEDWQTAEFRGSLVLPVNPGAGVPLAMRFGVGFADIVPAAWEAIPWSWMFDYFFNVSSVIDAWSAPVQHLGWANRTVRNGRTHHFSALRPQPNSTLGSSYSRYSASGGQAKATLQSIARSPISADEVRPPLRMKLPGFGTRWANLAAIASYGTDLRALRRALQSVKHR